MFHLLKVPFVFTLEASFAGASKGKTQGQHFSLGDFENIGKSVLKSVYYARNIEGNKRMLRELYLEAESMQLNDDGGDSDSNSSSSDSEEEKITETDKLKKAIEELQTSLEKQASPKGKEPLPMSIGALTICEQPVVRTK